MASTSVTTTRPPAKAPRVSDDIDTEECCACFGQYSDDIESGREWLECACGRWVHEDCVENIVYDTNAVSIVSFCNLIVAVHLLTLKMHKILFIIPFLIITYHCMSL